MQLHVNNQDNQVMRVDKLIHYYCAMISWPIAHTSKLKVGIATELLNSNYLSEGG